MSEKDNATVALPRPAGRGPGPMGGGPMAGMAFGGKAKDFKGSMKKLFKYLRPYYLQLLVAIIFSVASCVFAILAPTYINKITNEIAAPMVLQAMGIPASIDMSRVAEIGIMLIIIYVLNFSLGFLQGFLMAGVNQRVTRSLRGEISVKINKLPLKYFDQRTHGETLSRVTNDVDTIGNTLNQSLGMLISSTTMVIGVLIAMFVSKWQMALVAVTTVPVSLVLIVIVVGISQKFFSRQQRYLGELNGQIEEVFSGLNVVKAFNGEEKVLESFDKTNGELYKGAKMAQFLSGMMMPIMAFVANLAYVAICVVGGILLLNGKATPGDITSFFIYVRLFQNPLSQFAQVANSFQSAAAAAERVFEFLEEKEIADESEKSKKLESVKGNVEFKNVRFGYNADKTIIHDFSVSVKAGQKVAIVGPTGAGKTTLVNLLMRFYDVDSGDILIDGTSIYDMKREDVRSLFGMVLQDTWLFDGTVKENIRYNCENVTDEQIENACKAAGVHHFITTLPNGYDMRLDDQANISGGQKQLLTIARAMIQNSPMLILDEATSSVDTRTEQLIQNAMDNLTAGRTSFVIAHRLSTIKNADLILVLRDGDIVEKGNHAELLRQNGFYAGLYNSQFSE